jgi:hypothetical protein
MPANYRVAAEQGKTIPVIPDIERSEAVVSQFEMERLRLPPSRPNVFQGNPHHTNQYREANYAGSIEDGGRPCAAKVLNGQRWHSNDDECQYHSFEETDPSEHVILWHADLPSLPLSITVHECQEDRKAKNAPPM